MQDPIQLNLLTESTSPDDPRLTFDNGIVKKTFKTLEERERFDGLRERLISSIEGKQAAADERAKEQWGKIFNRHSKSYYKAAQLMGGFEGEVFDDPIAFPGFNKPLQD